MLVFSLLLFLTIAMPYAHASTYNTFLCVSQMAASSANVPHCWVCHPKPRSGLDHGDP